MRPDSIKQAVILAGGEGTRLRPLTYEVPKPMVLVNNRPFLEYLIEMLGENGISEVVLLLGYLPEKITRYFGDGSNFGVRIKYSIGKVPDKTGTRIKNAEHLLDDTFLLMYGDNYWPLNLERLLEYYTRQRTLASVTVYTNRDGSGEYGREKNIYVDENGRVLKYDKSRRDSRLNAVDIGFYIINKKALELIPNPEFSLEEEAMPLLIDRQQLSGYQTEHRYYYLTTPESLKLMEEFLQPKKVVFLDRDGVINKKAPEHDYIKSWGQFEFIPGAIKALKLLTENGYSSYIITNQQGIALGLMSEQNLAVIHQKLREELEKHGVRINQIYHCPHGKDEGCECRKPKPGLLFRAAREHNLNLAKAIFIGDDERDLQAGDAAGCKTVLVEAKKSLLEIVNSLIKT